MNDKVEIRRRKKETLITIAFTIFSVLLIYVAVATGWSPMIVPIIAIELGFVWWAHSNGYKNYKTRAFITTVFACINITFYGMYAENFLVIISTLCVFALLFSLYEVASIFYIVVLNSFLLLFYHLFVKQTFVISPIKVERERMVLQLLSYFVLLVLCIYTIRNNETRERDMEELQNNVKRVNKIKEDFVANTSHELRTPINTISGMSEIILQEDLSEKVHHEVLDIQMTSYELQNIVTDILDYAALESKSLELHPRQYNITSTLNDIMNATVYQNREKNLELIFDCNPSIPRYLYGDEEQIRRIINNLTTNAIKFTPEGGVRVSVDYREEDYGVNLMVSVKDTGIGMDQAQQERIFQSFYQADSDSNRRAEGMGLGLTISSGLIRSMGGFMTVKSELGKGSEFSFSIPQKVIDERPCIEVKNAQNIKALWYHSSNHIHASIRDDYSEHIHHLAEYLKVFIHRSASLSELKRRVKQSAYTHIFIGLEEYREDPIYFDDIAETMPVFLLADRDQEEFETSNIHVIYKPYNALNLAEIFNGGELVYNPSKYQKTERFIAPDAKVLVVDDNLMNLKVVEGLLSKYRIRITVASSGEEALKTIESKDFDFVFMDHMMPGMDGVECLHAIRAKDGAYFKKVPIIALTANAIAGSREMFLSEGFAEFVAKPIDNAVLDNVLRRFIPEIKQLPEEKKKQKPSEDTLKQDDLFANMEGINKQAGLTYCGGSVEDYIEMASIYYESGQDYYNNLIEYHDNKDWKNYSILSHAIKSTSKMIGASKLSDLAYKEEMASKEQDEKTVEQYHEPLLKEYRRVLDMIGNNPMIVQPTEAVKEVIKKTLTKEDVISFMETLKEKIETYETGSIHEYLKTYEGSSYEGKTLTEITKEVIQEVDAFNYMEAENKLNNLLEGLK